MPCLSHSFCLDSCSHGLKFLLLKSSWSTPLGVISTKKDALHSVPRCIILWAKYSTQAWLEQQRWPPTNHTLHQPVYKLLIAVASLLFFHAHHYPSHQRLCAYFAASHWGPSPSVKAPQWDRNNLATWDVLAEFGSQTAQYLLANN